MNAAFDFIEAHANDTPAKARVVNAAPAKARVSG